MENVRTNASCLVRHSQSGAKNLNIIYLKNVQKALKWPLQCVDFRKCFGGTCPPDPSRAVFVPQFASNYAGKNTLDKNVEI